MQSLQQQVRDKSLYYPAKNRIKPTQTTDNHQSAERHLSCDRDGNEIRLGFWSHCRCRCLHVCVSLCVCLECAQYSSRLSTVRRNAFQQLLTTMRAELPPRATIAADANRICLGIKCMRFPFNKTI